MKKILSKFWRRCHVAVLLLCLLFTASLSYGQSVVNGNVTDENGDTMPGVNVLIKGTSTGTVTDFEGNYSISATSDQSIIFSFVGYVTQEIVVGNQSTLNVVMQSDIQQLQEIVVTGYATQEKKDLTGSVGIVTPKDLTALPTNNVTSQLQGRVAGVTITQDSRPGANAKVRIRGFGSFQNNDPLYVVDGVPTQDISTINPNDIESLSVLKDAGAASIYGSRAANGVVVITTKKGNGGLQVNYNMYVGVQDPGKGPDNLTNTQEYADLQWLVYNNDGTSEEHPIYGPSPALGGASPQIPSWAANTDWFDVTTRKAPIMSHDLSLSTATENAKFFGSVSWYKQQGITIKNFTERFTARFNTEFNIKDRVTIGENLTASFRTGNGIDANGSETTPMAYVYRAQTIVPVILTEEINGFQPGQYGGTALAPTLGNGFNPLADYSRNEDDRSSDIRMFGSIYADVKLLESLHFKTTLGGTIQNGYSTDWNGTTYERAENVATATYQESSYYNHDWVWTNTLTYDKKFGSSDLLVVAGYEAVKYGLHRDVLAQRAGYFSEQPDYRSVSNGATLTRAESNVDNPTTLASSFIRADYSFNDKYLLSGTVRRDGSSRFGSNNKYGTFPSVSAGWRIIEEDFMADNHVFSDLKLRGGYGTMGNQLAINPVNQYYLYGGASNKTFYDLNGSGNSSLQGFSSTRIGNPDAKWETNITTNIGIDAAFFENRLQLVFDWYQKKTKDLLYNPQLPAPAGLAEVPFVNIAEMVNKGIDLQLIYRNSFSNDLRFEGNFTFTTYNNEIKKISDSFDFFDSGDGTRIGTFNRNEVGHSIGELFGYQVIGLFQDDAEVASAPAQTDAEPGFFRYADIDGDNEITPEDRTYVGNPNPDFTYGLNLSLTYKHFDVTAFFYGSEGNDIANYNKWWVDFWPSFQGIKSTDLLNRSWTPENTNTDVPKASSKLNFSTNTEKTSYYVEDGSFLKMKNLQIGYNFSPEFITKIGFRSARIYLQGVNLFTITGYSGLDPELATFADLNPGVDEFNNPNVKQYLIGVNIGF